MPGETEQLSVSVVGEGQSAEKMLQTLASSLNTFLQTANKALGAWAKLTDTIESRANSALGKADSAVENVNSALLKTDMILAPVVAQINDFATSLRGGATAGKEFTSATEKAGTAAKETAEAANKNADAIGRLNLEYRAGKITFAEYISGLKDVADAAESSEQTQLRAIATVRAARESAAAAAERDAKKATREAVASAAAADRNARKAVREATAADRAQTRDQSTVGNTFSSVGSTLTQSVTRLVVAGGQDAIAAAGALESSQERVKAIFGESASSIEKWGDTASEAFATSKREALSNAAGLGEVLTEMGVGKSKAAEMSEGVVELATKFAILKGVEPQKALTAFTAAMAGGKASGALRQFGVDLSANTIKMEAAKEGMVSYSVNQEKVSLATDAVARASENAKEAEEKHGEASKQAMAAHDALAQAQDRLRKATAGTAAALTPAQKAQVVYNLLLKHSADASKGFAAVQDSQAVVQRKLAAVTEDTAAAYGKQLLPALISGEKLLIRVYTALEHLSPAAKTSLLVVAGLAAAMGPLASGIGFVVNGLLLWDRTSLFLRNGFPAALDAIKTKLGLVTVGTEEAAAADAELATAAEGAATAETETAAAGILAFGPAAPLVLAIVALSALVVGLGVAWNGVKEAQDEAAKSARDFAKAEDEATAKGKHHDLQVKSTHLAQQITDKQEAMNAPVGVLDGPRTPAMMDKDNADLAALQSQKAQVDAALKATPLDPVHRPPGTPGVGTGEAKGSGDGGAAAALKRYEDAMAKAQAEAGKLTSGGGKKGGGGGYKPDMPMPNLGDLEPIEALIGSNPMAKDTNAENYAVQVSTLKDRFAQEEMKRLKAGGGSFDADAFKRQQLGHSLNLNTNAETATRSEMAKLLPITEAAAEKVKALRAQLNTLRSEMSGSKATDAQKKRYSDLFGEYGNSRKSYESDFKSLEMNRRVNSEAINAKAEDVRALGQMNAAALARSRSGWLEAQKAALTKGLDDPTTIGKDVTTGKEGGGINRDSYDSQLKAAIARITHENGPDSPDLKAFKTALEESVKAREAAKKEVLTATARLTKNDFDLKKGEIDAEAARRLASNPQDAANIGAWKTAATGDNDRARFNSNFGAQDEQQKANVQDGSESLEQYQAFLAKMRDAAKAAFGETDLIVAKLNYDLAQGGLAIVASDAEKAKEAYDAGGVSMEQYRARLVALRAGVSESSAAYKELTGTIHGLDLSALSQQAQAAKEAYESGAISVDAYRQRLQALRGEVAQGSAEYKAYTGSMLDLDRAMIDRARQAATAVGSSFADMVMQVAQNVGSAGATVRNFLHGIGEDIVKRNIAAAAAKAVRGGQAASDPKLSAAQREIDAAQKQAAQAQKEAGAGLTKAAGDLSGAAQTLGGSAAGAAAAGAAGTGTGAAGDVAAGVGVAGQAVAAIKDGHPADAAGAVESAAKSGWLGKALAASVPIIGGMLAAGSFLSDLVSRPKIDFTTHSGEGIGAALGRGDHSGLFDSGFAGSASLRGLLSQNSAKRVTQIKQGDMHVTVHVHPSAGMNERAVGQIVTEAISDFHQQQRQRDAIQDAGTPTV